MPPQNDPGPSHPCVKPKTHKPAYTKLELSYLYIPADNTSTSSGVKITAGEPIFVNPNSHSSVIKVLREIGHQTNITKYVKGGCREWVAITCDGLPFSIAQRVLKETYTCPTCHTAIFTRKNYISHVKDHEEYADMSEDDLPFDFEFDWTILRIGHGHFEMNMVRSFFKLNWDVCIKELAKCMDFCSENAQKYAKSGGDHHKAWELLQILYLGCIDELILPCVRECLQKDLVSTPDGFLRWTRDIKNHRYQYLQEQMLTYASAIIHLRRGIRQNDMALVLAGRVKYAPIFHSRNHPKYQQIELTELSNFLTAPTALQDFLKTYQAISTSVDPERCEDMDFVLEAINKKSKSWAPRGVPTHQEWQKIFRNLQKFDELRSAVFSRMRRYDPDAEKRYKSSHIARDEEVTAWRTCLRGSNFLDNPFTSDAPFTSVSAEKLDPELVHLTNQAVKRRRYFARKMFGVAQEDDSAEPSQVFVTEAERAQHNDIRNQRKETIATRVLTAINALDDAGIKTLLLAEWEMSVKNKKREDYISFFFRVEEEVAHPG
ncbi:uncharacterized protein LOC129284191 [Lytechinus pictus]|uniref:uncharacterized protein LOC129284191 n=1 Tax=Lytechinus pictus TaxID=7653 RepID=UPI0030B9FF95